MNDYKELFYLFTHQKGGVVQAQSDLLPDSYLLNNIEGT